LPAIIGIGLYNLKANLDRESALTTEIAENLSVVKRQLWSLHKKFAREIHGGLQSQLQVIALKFKQDEANHDELIESLNNEFTALLETEVAKPRIENFTVFISELVEFWDGIATISPNIDNEIYKVISQDSLLIECLHEVIREAVNNAVKHSGATTIEISIREISTSTIELVVENNVVKALEKSTRESLGTAIYKELAHSYQLRFSQDRVCLEAQFILATSQVFEGSPL
jgi:nitrate/nitrite-specific signal transduction histidine kinase